MGGLIYKLLGYLSFGINFFSTILTPIDGFSLFSFPSAALASFANVFVGLLVDVLFNEWTVQIFGEFDGDGENALFKSVLFESKINGSNLMFFEIFFGLQIWSTTIFGITNLLTLFLWPIKDFATCFFGSMFEDDVLSGALIIRSSDESANFIIFNDVFATETFAETLSLPFALCCFGFIWWYNVQFTIIYISTNQTSITIFLLTNLCEYNRYDYHNQ